MSIWKQWKEFRNWRRHHRRFIAFFTVTINKNKYFVMSQTIIVGGKTVWGIEVYDTTSGDVLTNAVLSAEQYTTDNAAATTLSPDVATPSEEDIIGAAPGTANISGSVTADLSAYGLGNAVVLPVSAVPLTVITPVTPAARFKVIS